MNKTYTTEELEKAQASYREWCQKYNAAHPMTGNESDDDPERHRDIEWEVEEKYGDGVRLTAR